MNTLGIFDFLLHPRKKKSKKYSDLSSFHQHPPSSTIPTLPELTEKKALRDQLSKETSSRPSSQMFQQPPSSPCFSFKSNKETQAKGRGQIPSVPVTGPMAQV